MTESSQQAERNQTTQRNETAGRPGADQVDPRGPKFAASVTAVLLLIAAFITMTAGISVNPGEFSAMTFADRLVSPGFLVALPLFLLFLWGAVAGVKKHPFGLFFAAVVRPRLQAPKYLEPAAPPTFAQGIGAFVVGLGLVLHLVGVPLALLIALSAAFVAAFLNAAFGFCIGCEMYLVLRRTGLLRTA